MSKRAGKTIIGLTGNIGTGKSAVRRLLEQRGAFGIDADLLAHRTIAKGSPGFQPVADLFGNWVIGEDGEIDRRRLGRIVFNDPQALSELEKIIHPLVTQGANWLINHTRSPVVVIEAIKLLESSLVEICDSIWVVEAPESVQAARLVQTRGMLEADALQRIRSQSPQAEKLARADVIIRNDGPMEETHQQILEAWERIIPQPLPVEAPDEGETPHEDPLNVERVLLKDSAELQEFLNHIDHPLFNATDESVREQMNGFALLSAKRNGKILGAAAWRADNLVARMPMIDVLPEYDPAQVLPPLLTAMEEAASRLQCEAAVLFVRSELTAPAVWNRLGYESKSPQSLAAPAWQEAGLESGWDGAALYFKQLRAARILRPI